MVASTRNTRQLTTDYEGDLDLTENEINLGELSETLSRVASEQGRPASPTTPDTPSPTGSQSPTTPRPLRTMAAPMSRATSVQGSGNLPANNMIALTQDQFQQLLQANQGSQEQKTRRPKVKEPDTFHGERTKLRGFLVQLEIYFSNQPHIFDNDKAKNGFAVSLLRDAAEKWITPYVEETIETPWRSWVELKQALKKMFGDIGAKEAAQNKLEKLRQGSRTMTDYWNEFRLLATDAEFEDGTNKRLLLKGMSTKLQEYWAQQEREFESTEDLADWAVKKENKINTVKQIQAGQQHYHQTTRNQDGTFKPQTTTTTQGGDAMDLDATNRKRFSNLSTQERERRMKNRLCLRCGKPGHMIRDCRVAQAKIKELSTEEEVQPEEHLNEQGSL